MMEDFKEKELEMNQSYHFENKKSVNNKNKKKKGQYYEFKEEFDDNISIEAEILEKQKIKNFDDIFDSALEIKKPKTKSKNNIRSKSPKTKNILSKKNKPKSNSEFRNIFKNSQPKRSSKANFSKPQINQNRQDIQENVIAFNPEIIMQRRQQSHPFQGLEAQLNYHENQFKNRRAQIPDEKKKERKMMDDEDLLNLDVDNFDDSKYEVFNELNNK